MQTESELPIDKLNKEQIKKSLREQFYNVNYDLTKRDIFPFITDRQALNLWSKYRKR